MALIPPHAGPITQAFGPTANTIEYPAYGTHDEGTWSPLGTWPRYTHFHMAEDIGAAEGTPIVASEAGKVIYSGYDSSGGGYKIEVQIKAGTSYSSNHCSHLYKAVGAVVTKGQTIAAVGHTGLASGPHNHFWVEHDEVHSGQLRHVFYRPSLFYAGGALANVDWIQPATQHVALNAYGTNIRTQPYAAQGVVYAQSKTESGALPGIYRVSDNYRITYLTYPMLFKGWFKGDVAFGTYLWAEVRLPDSSTRRLFVKKELIHFV